MGRRQHYFGISRVKSHRHTGDMGTCSRAPMGLELPGWEALIAHSASPRPSSPSPLSCKTHGCPLALIVCCSFSFETLFLSGRFLKKSRWYRASISKWTKDMLIAQTKISGEMSRADTREQADSPNGTRKEPNRINRWRTMWGTRILPHAKK